MEARLRQVTEAEFWAALRADDRDIHPRVVSAFDPVTHYTSEWRTQDWRQTLFGKSDGGSDNRRFWLADR